MGGNYFCGKMSKKAFINLKHKSMIQLPSKQTTNKAPSIFGVFLTICYTKFDPNRFINNKVRIC